MRDELALADLPTVVGIAQLNKLIANLHKRVIKCKLEFNSNSTTCSRTRCEDDSEGCDARLPGTSSFALRNQAFEAQSEDP